MGQLYILRHGIAVPHGTPGIADDERPLTSKGVRRMKQVAEGLRRLRVAPERIVSSPLPRTRRTAEIVADRLGMADRLDFDDALRPDRDASSIREWLNGRDGESLMIVGHNPAVSGLVTVLPLGPGTPTCIELKKGGLAVFEAIEGRGYELLWVATPRLLRRAGR